MKKNLSKISVGIVCALLGVLIVFQIRASKVSKGKGVYMGTDIQADINDLKDTKKNLSSANAELKEKVNSLEEDAAETNEEGQKIKDDLFYERVNLGMIDVTGEGIEITIKPKNTMFGQKAKDSSKAIEQNDLVKIIDALWFGGAEAVSINDIRITIQTGISTSGSEILVGSAGKINSADTLSIKAIGDFDKMKKNISEEFSVVSNSNLIQNYNINMENNKNLVIEKSSQSILSNHLNNIYDNHDNIDNKEENKNNK